MSISAIIFDLDDTLVVEVASAETAFLETCELAQQEYGIEPDQLHKTVRQKARQLWYNYPARDYCVAIGISSWEGLWARFHGDKLHLKSLRQWSPIYRQKT